MCGCLLMLPQNEVFIIYNLIVDIVMAITGRQCSLLLNINEKTWISSERRRLNALVVIYLGRYVRIMKLLNTFDKSFLCQLSEWSDPADSDICTT